MFSVIPDPKTLFEARKFLGIALDPPDFEPGSWIGAGNCVRDMGNDDFVLCARHRSAKERLRGFAIGVYRSADGFSFEATSEIKKEWLSNKTGFEIRSLEGAQLVQNPINREWHLYVSVNIDEEFIWGGIHWQTYLLTSQSPDGPWIPRELVLRNDETYDRHHARDGSFGIVDGKWICIYKARDESHLAQPALATSSDGIKWRKLGPLKVDGAVRHCWMSGTFFSESDGPIFVGLEKDEAEPEPDVVHADEHAVGHGGGPARNFVSYRLDADSRNLESVFRSPWVAGSQYEHTDHPVLGYMSMVQDEARHRMLIYIEALDPKYTKRIGINETVERLLVYEAPYRTNGRAK